MAYLDEDLVQIAIGYGQIGQPISIEVADDLGQIARVSISAGNTDGDFEGSISIVELA